MRLKKINKMAIKKLEVKKFTKTVEVLDHESIPTGTYFTAKYRNKVISGIVYNDKASKNLYFYQNACDYNTPPVNIQGYKFCVRLSYGVDLKVLPILLVEFPNPLKGFKLPLILPMIAGYNPSIVKGFVKIGCKDIPNEDIRFLVKHLKD